MKKLALRTLLILFFIAPFSESFAQQKAYKLFNENGRNASYDKMVDQCKRADVILFGELHNNPISHWLQLELTEDLFELLGTKLVLGAEMFETDNQLIMDEYFSGLITQNKFEDEMRLWVNYHTDYKPLIEFARDSGLKFIATNIPRRYANMVYNKGLVSLFKLSDQAKSFMMPLPLIYDTTLNCYSSLSHGGAPMGGHGGANLRDAQAVKDATMAYNILGNHGRGDTFLHFNGAYHSDKFESINFFLKEKNPSLEIITISTVLQDDIKKLEDSNKGLANYIICIPSNMTPTYNSK